MSINLKMMWLTVFRPFAWIGKCRGNILHLFPCEKTLLAENIFRVPNRENDAPRKFKLDYFARSAKIPTLRRIPMVALSEMFFHRWVCRVLKRVPKYPKSRQQKQFINCGQQIARPTASGFSYIRECVRIRADLRGQGARIGERRFFLARWPLAGSLESASSAPQTSSQLHNSVHFLIWLSNLSELALMLSKLLEKGVLRSKIILWRRLQYYLNEFDVSSKEKSFERISHSCSRAFLSYVGIAKRARSFGLTMPRA